jgi:hypothetical protein
LASLVGASDDAVAKAGRGYHRWDEKRTTIKKENRRENAIKKASR